MTVLTNMACQITAAGCSRPAFSDILETLQSLFKGIYGADIYIPADSQDGQMLAVVAKAIDDSNAAVQAAYGSFSPATAQGVALSSAVKINGIARAVATSSTAVLTITGTAGTVITNGIALDTSGNRWFLPPVVTIGAGASVTVTATAEFPGSINMPSNTINKIGTPTLGWHGVANPSASVPGAPVESDAALRQRQQVSVALPSKTVLDGVLAGILALPGVTQAKPYENDTDVVDANGLPKHSIALVVQGGVDSDIAGTILMKKGPGCSTYGTTAIAGLYDSQGVGPYTINFFRPTQKNIIATVTVKAGVGYTTSTGALIQAAVLAHINGLGIGKKVDWGKVVLMSQLFGTADYGKFEIDAVALGISGGSTAATDVAVAFNEIANITLANITLSVS